MHCVAMTTTKNIFTAICNYFRSLQVMLYYSTFDIYLDFHVAHWYVASVGKVLNIRHIQGALGFGNAGISP